MFNTLTMDAAIFYSTLLCDSDLLLVTYPYHNTRLRMTLYISDEYKAMVLHRKMHHVKHSGFNHLLNNMGTHILHALA